MQRDRAREGRQVPFDIGANYRRCPLSSLPSGRGVIRDSSREIPQICRQSRGDICIEVQRGQMSRKLRIASVTKDFTERFIFIIDKMVFPIDLIARVHDY